MKTAKHEAIIDAAESLIAQRGFAKVAVAEIARAAGLARATVYLHFRGKAEIGLACQDRAHGRLLDILRALMSCELTAAERLRRMLVRRVLFALDEAQKVSVKFDDMYAAIRPQYMIRRERYLDNEAALFLRVLKEAQRSGELVVENAPLTALALVLSTNSLMPFSLNARQLKARNEVEQRAEKIADLVLNGLRPPGRRRIARVKG
ncbi:MAG TPA: helix-turn-helix domain-containing protein [Steroidobacteraceae bacterium]|nr:helix-turn-helix domain-containing protein [Steroidobacteraceae bacterium]